MIGICPDLPGSATKSGTFVIYPSTLFLFFNRKVVAPSKKLSAPRLRADALREKVSTLIVRADAPSKKLSAPRLRADALSEKVSTLIVRADAPNEKVSALSLRADALSEKVSTLIVRADVLGAKVSTLTGRADAPNKKALAPSLTAVALTGNQEPGNNDLFDKQNSSTKTRLNLKTTN